MQPEDVASVEVVDHDVPFVATMGDDLSPFTTIIRTGGALSLISFLAQGSTTRKGSVG